MREEFQSSRIWASLGKVLADHLGRNDEAAYAYHRATEINPLDAGIWRAFGDLLLNDIARQNEAEAAYRRAVEVDPKDVRTWRRLGDLYSYFLDRPEMAELAYQKVLQFQPENLVAANSLLAIHLTLPDRQSETEAAFESIVSRAPPECANLLRIIRALAQNNFGDAINALKDALLRLNEGVSRDYVGFYVLVLRLAARQGFGEKLLAWLDEQGLGDRYWPLRAAYDAYLHGEGRLMDVNPEVRGAAKLIYEMLDCPRRYKEKSPAEKDSPEKPRKNAKRKTGRRIPPKTEPLPA